MVVTMAVAIENNSRLEHEWEVLTGTVHQLNQDATKIRPGEKIRKAVQIPTYDYPPTTLRFVSPDLLCPCIPPRINLFQSSRTSYLCDCDHIHKGVSVTISPCGWKKWWPW